jgi:cytochrome c biogenesis factor
MSPTEISFYANHSDAQLEACITKAAQSGSYIAANSGADHPLAVEYAAMWAAATGAALLRSIAA